MSNQKWNCSLPTNNNFLATNTKMTPKVAPNLGTMDHSSVVFNDLIFKPGDRVMFKKQRSHLADYFDISERGISSFYPSIPH